MDLSPASPFDMKTVPIDTQPMAEQRSAGMGVGLGVGGEPSRPDAKKVGLSLLVCCWLLDCKLNKILTEKKCSSISYFSWGNYALLC